MSKYTTQVRFICESLANLTESGGVNSVDSIIDNSWNKIFEGFPIFDERYRKELCVKILKHYYTREIGEETFGLWKLRLNTTMNEIMPYYNKLYESTLLQFDPLINKDITRNVVGDSSGTGTSKQSSSGGSVNKYNKTPQGGLTGIETGKYLTDARIIDENISADNVSTVKQNDKTNETIKGKDSETSYSKLIMEYRDSLINVDLQVIGALSDCFMGIW